MNKAHFEQLAMALRAAELTHTPLPPITGRYPDFSIADAYAVQMHMVETRVKEGGVIIGKKVGLTSKPMQDFLGVDQPDYGHLFQDMLFSEEERLSITAFLQPRIEAEIAFVLGEDLKGPGITLVDVLRCTHAVVPAFEIISSRIQDWKIKIQDTVADNGSSAGCVLGATLSLPNACNLKHVGLVLEKNGTIIDTAAGAAVMGHPAQAVAWLANTLGAQGIALRKGEIVLSGSLTKAYEITAGDVFTAHFGGLGSVKAVFGQ